MLSVSFAREALDFELVYRFLSEEARWSRGISRATVQRALDNSICVSVFEDAKQIGFARVVTDRATFAYLNDVFVLPEHRGTGAARLMVQSILEYPDLQHLRRFMLATSTAHGLYAKFGFATPDRPENVMERFDPDAYTRRDS